MRKLDRTTVTAPACLASCDYTAHTWASCPPLNKSEIWSCLESMQGKRCAYCESDLGHSQHIEHFRRRRDFPALTFNWDNLFGSCNYVDSCGQHKDTKGCPYNPDELVDPCHDDPDHFFKFRADGTIDIRSGLSAQEQRKAEETLRVFNLNPQYGRLRNMRTCAISGYIKMADEAVKAGLTGSDMHELFADELVVTAHLPFSTAIRHVLTEI